MDIVNRPKFLSRSRRFELVAAGGLCALTACGPDGEVGAPVNQNAAEAAGPGADVEDAPPPEVGEAPDAPEGPAAEAPTPEVHLPLTDQERIDAGLAHLDALEFLDTGALFEARTVHGWIPYGGFWNSASVPLELTEVADRLEDFVARVDETVTGFEGPGVDAGFANANGENSLCWSLGQDDGAHCLTIEAYDADVAALNALEIIEVDGIVFAANAQQGMCYSSWITVTADDCLRAQQLHALVEATRDLPSSVPPAGGPDE